MKLNMNQIHHMVLKFELLKSFNVKLKRKIFVGDLDLSAIVIDGGIAE